MKYGLAFRYILDRPGGFVNLLLIMVCQFIPVLGPIVLIGYRAEVSVALSHDPKLRRHSKLDFNRFVDYLKRGIWPFLMSLILSLPIIPIFAGAVFLGFVIDPPGPNHPPFLALAIAGVVYTLSSLVLLTLLVPMTFHSEITGRLDIGGAFRFTLSFWGRVGFLAVWTGFVFSILTFLISILGLLCFFVGIYPAMALVTMTGQHLLVQLYRAYLDRGGEPLEEYEPPHLEDREHEILVDEDEDDTNRQEW
jgi:hypothetical protein